MWHKLPAPLVIATMTISGCGAEAMHTIAEIEDQHEALNGQTVRIQGWIAGCQPLGCHLAENADGSGKNLSLGTSPEFDAALLRNAGAVFVIDHNRKVVVGNPNGRTLFVEIQGLVDRTCFDHRDEAQVQTQFCFDRADEIQNPRLLKVIKSGPLPHQGRK